MKLFTSLNHLILSGGNTPFGNIPEKTVKETFPVCNDRCNSEFHFYFFPTFPHPWQFYPSFIYYFPFLNSKEPGKTFAVLFTKRGRNNKIGQLFGNCFFSRIVKYVLC
jgi:hypothetical protein